MVTRLLILAALLAGCEKRSELYCEKNPEDLAHCPSLDAPEMPQVMCNDNSMCTQGDKLLCNTASHVCVSCLSNVDCTDPNKDNCDPGSGTCRGCVVHTDCPSDVCLPGGTCGDDSNTVYLDADAGADTGDGTKAKPVKGWAKALMLVTTGRKYLKVTGTTTSSVTIDGKNVIVLAGPGAKIVGAMDPVLKLKSSSVKVYDLEVTCATPATAANAIHTEGSSSVSLEHVYAHDCGKSGIDATDGVLSCSRSTIQANADGVVLASKVAFIITNSMIVRNGSASAAHGGVELGSLAATNRFEFNTVADNAAPGGLGPAGGINCPISLTDSLLIPNNLIVGNTGGNVGGSCTTTGSAVDTDASKWMFKSQAAAPYDYHLTAASTMAIDMATTPTAIIDDIDGQLRPQGAQRDYGADEFRP